MSRRRSRNYRKHVSASTLLFKVSSKARFLILQRSNYVSIICMRLHTILLVKIYWSHQWLHAATKSRWALCFILAINFKFHIFSTIMPSAAMSIIVNKYRRRQASRQQRKMHGQVRANVRDICHTFITRQHHARLIFIWNYFALREIISRYHCIVPGSQSLTR